MFTFVRILTNNIVHSTTTNHPSPSEADTEHALDQPAVNPWKKELDRLARSQCQNAGLPAYRKTPALPRPEPQGPSAKLSKHGTLSEQRIWWGKALAHYTLPPGGEPGSRLIPPKTIRRWQQ